MISKIRVFHDEAPEITGFGADGFAGRPSMVSDLGVLVASWITSCPAVVSLSLIEAVTLMVLLASPLVSAVAMAFRRSLSVETLNVLRAMRDSRPSRNRPKDR
jgi:hypothetical protein